MFGEVGGVFKVDGVVVVSWRTGTLVLGTVGLSSVCSQLCEDRSGYMDRERDIMRGGHLSSFHLAAHQHHGQLSGHPLCV